MKRSQVGLALILGLTTSSAAAEFSAELFQQLCASVQTVRAVGPSGRAYFGSSVLVAPGRAVTNCHVVREASSIQIGRGSYAAPAEALAGDLSRDLCMVDVPTGGGQSEPCAKRHHAGSRRNRLCCGL
jgi:serine protease Do